MFFYNFISIYVQFSLMCLIKDIFIGEHNIIKYDLQNTVDLYRSSFNKNFENLVNLIPFFVIFEINYYYCDDYNYLKSPFQLAFEIYFGYFIYVIMLSIRGTENNDNENKFVCVFNILNQNVTFMYLNILLPICFLPFTIGLNKLTIDLTFYLSLLYFCAKYSNFSIFVNACEILESNLKLREFEIEVIKVFNIVSEKYNKYTSSEGIIKLNFSNKLQNSINKEISNEILNEISKSTSNNINQENQSEKEDLKLD